VSATGKQIELIRTLDEKLGYDTDERRLEVMTVSEASELIRELKNELEG